MRDEQLGSEDNRRGERWIVFLFLVVLAIATVLRFRALDNSLPYVVGPDEGFEIHRALRLGAGEVDLERNAKGGFFYLLFAEYGCYFAWLRLTGAIGSVQEFADRFALDITPFWMIARVTHVCVSLLVTVATFALGRRAYGRRAGLIGAAAAGLSTLLVSRSHYVGVDLPMTLLVLLALKVALDWADPAHRVRPLVLGVLLGAATMTKLPAVVLVVPIAAANWLRFRRDSWLRGLFGREVIVAYGVGLLVFAVGNPGFVLKMPEFFDEVIGEVLLGNVAGSEDVYREAGPEKNLWLYYWQALGTAMGWPLFGLGVAGAGWAAYVRRRADLVLLAFVVPLYVAIAGVQTSHLYYLRYVIPLVPLLALLGGRAFASGVDSLPLQPRWRKALSLAVGAVLLAPMVAASVHWSNLNARKDSRVYARHWVEENIPDGASIFLLGNPVVDRAPGLSLPLRATDENLDELSRRALEEGSPARAAFLAAQKSGPGKSFDLHTVKHFDIVAGLDHWKKEGVQYFALLRDDFAEDDLATRERFPSRVRQSRLELYEQLLSSPRAERVLLVEPGKRRWKGPTVEIFHLPTAEPP